MKDLDSFYSKKPKKSPVNSYRCFLRNPDIKKKPRGAAFEGAPTLLSGSETRAETRNNLFLSFYEGAFVVKTIRDEVEKRQPYYLRYEIFSQRLKWTKGNQEMMERDEYDESAIFLGVFKDQKRLVAYLRLLLPDKPFMLEKVFSMLVGYNTPQKLDRGIRWMLACHNREGGVARCVTCGEDMMLLLRPRSPWKL